MFLEAMFLKEGKSWARPCSLDSSPAIWRLGSTYNTVIYIVHALMVRIFSLLKAKPTLSGVRIGSTSGTAPGRYPHLVKNERGSVTYEKEGRKVIVWYDLKP